MGNTRGKHLNPDGYLPIGHLCGGLEVISERVARTDGKKNNKYGYICLCRFCLTQKWVSYASLSGRCAKSCGCMSKEWLRKANTKNEVLLNEDNFIEKWSR